MRRITNELRARIAAAAAGPVIGSTRARIIFGAGAVLLLAAAVFLMTGSSEQSRLIQGSWVDSKNRFVRMECADGGRITMAAGFKTLLGQYSLINDTTLEADFRESNASLLPWRLTLSFADSGNTLTTTSMEGITRTWRRIP